MWAYVIRKESSVSERREFANSTRVVCLTIGGKYDVCVVSPVCVALAFVWLRGCSTQHGVSVLQYPADSDGLVIKINIIVAECQPIFFNEVA